MGAMASQITSLTIVYSTVYSDADQRKHQSSASLAFVRGIHRGPVNSSHKWPVTRKMSPFDDVFMINWEAIAHDYHTKWFYEDKSTLVSENRIGCEYVRIWVSKTMVTEVYDSCAINTLRPKQNGHRFADDTFKRIFLNENVRISIKISLKFVPKGPINNNPALVQIMAWRRSGDKPLSEPIMVSLLTHICVTRPQWVNKSNGVS